MTRGHRSVGLPASRSSALGSEGPLVSCPRHLRSALAGRLRHARAVLGDRARPRPRAGQHRPAPASSSARCTARAATAARYNADYVELYNPTDAAISVDGCRCTTAPRRRHPRRSDATDRHGRSADSHYLVQMGVAGATTALPTPDATGVGLHGRRRWPGAPARRARPPSPHTRRHEGRPPVVDMVGVGATPTTFETATPASALDGHVGTARTATGADTDNNAADFSRRTPPTPSERRRPATPRRRPSTRPSPRSRAPATRAPLAATRDHPGRRDRGVPDRRLLRLRAPDRRHRRRRRRHPRRVGRPLRPPAQRRRRRRDRSTTSRSPGWCPSASAAPQLTYDPTAGALEVLDEPFDPVTPLVTDWWPTADRSARPTRASCSTPPASFTVTNNYTTNRFGEIGLATGDRPLVTADRRRQPEPRPARLPGSRRRQLRPRRGARRRRQLGLPERRASWTTPCPGSTATHRPGRAPGRRCTAPVILDYGNSDWRVPADQPGDRRRSPSRRRSATRGPTTLLPQPVGGDIKARDVQRPQLLQHHRRGLRRRGWQPAPTSRTGTASGSQRRVHP